MMYCFLFPQKTISAQDNIIPLSSHHHLLDSAGLGDVVILPPKCLALHVGSHAAV